MELLVSTTYGEGWKRFKVSQIEKAARWAARLERKNLKTYVFLMDFNDTISPKRAKLYETEDPIGMWML